jgi:hypothetical protein
MRRTVGAQSDLAIRGWRADACSLTRAWRRHAETTIGDLRKAGVLLTVAVIVSTVLLGDSDASRIDSGFCLGA